MKYLFILLTIAIVNAAEAQCFGIYNAANHGIATYGSSFRLTTGNIEYDRALQREVEILNPAFKVNVQTYVFDDSQSPNAFACPDITNQNRRDGTIAFGQTLMREQFNVSNWGAAIPLILAHEFGHIKAFKNHWQFSQNERTVKKDELFADFTAGCYMYDRSNILTTDIDIVRQVFYSLGDNAFSSPDHHGTPQEREAALMAGYRFTEQFRTNQSGAVLSDSILRSAFLSFLARN